MPPADGAYPLFILVRPRFELVGHPYCVATKPFLAMGRKCTKSAVYMPRYIKPWISTSTFTTSLPTFKLSVNKVHITSGSIAVKSRFKMQNIRFIPPLNLDRAMLAYDSPMWTGKTFSADAKCVDDRHYASGSRPNFRGLVRSIFTPGSAFIYYVRRVQQLRR